MMDIQSGGKERFTFLCIAFLFGCILAVAPVAALHDVSVSIDQPGGPCSPAEKCILFEIDAGLTGNDQHSFFVSFPKDDISVPLTIDPDCVNISWNDNGTWTTPVHPNATEVNDTFPNQQLCPDTTTVRILNPIGIPTNKYVEICFLPCSDIALIGCNYTACVGTDEENVSVQSNNSVSLMYNVTIIPGENGTIVAETPPPYPCGSTPSFDFIPDCGYKVCNVCITPLGGNDPCLGPMSSYTFDPLDQCYEISAEFCPIGNISGYKLDKEGNPLSGWEIRLFNMTALVETNTTGADGKYTFEDLDLGNYTVNETLQPGWMQIGPPGGFYQVEINYDNRVFTDLNFTNEQIGNISGYKLNDATGLGIPGWLMNLSNESVINIHNTSTDGSGFYLFAGLPFDTYTVAEELKPGWANITPTSVGDLVIDGDTLNIGNVNFTNEQNGTISGYKLDNTTGLGIPDWLMTLSNESAANIQNTSTNGLGFYIFTGLPFETYTVTEELKPGYTNVTPLSQDDLVINEENPSIENVNFTNELEKFCIDGYKLDETGLGLEGWTITVTDDQEQEVGTDVTNETGFYRICGLVPGDYTVTEDLKDGWLNQTPLSVSVTVDESNVDNVNFTNELEKFCIDGYKLDETGLGLEGWTITVTDDQEQEVGTDITNETGFYRICGLVPGDYTVTEDLKDGWLNQTPLSVSVTIDESNVDNVNFTNELEKFCIDGYKLDETGLGLEGWTITVTDDQEQEVGTDVTNETGFYRICGLVPGDYTVTEDLKDGWLNQTPLSVSVTIDESNVDNVNFTNELEKFCIDGYKLDETGLGLEGWTITVTDDQEQEVGTDITNETGFYRICGLVPGDYTVTEDLKEGWMNLTPLSVSVTVDESNVDNVNFTNELEKFCIDGYKLDETGLGLEGWTITVTDDQEQEVGTDITNETGFYRICGLVPGDYTVTEDLKEGWLNLTPLSVSVTVDESNVDNVNFTNELEKFCIDGYKLDETGLGLEGWTITVTDDQEQEVGTDITNETGFYRICGLVPGDYTVTEDLKEGWLNLTPLSVSVTVDESNVDNVNFTNELEKFCIDGYKLDETGLGLEGWTITVTDDQEQEVGTDITNETGFYRICGLVPGDYTVTEDLKEGWLNLTPLSVSVTVDESNVDNVNFTNELEKFCIDGYKLDETGLGLEGWTITVTDDQEQEVGTDITNETGFYRICGLVPGDYTVTEDLKEGWMNQTPLSVSVTVDESNVDNVNFTNELEKFCIDGYKLDETGLGLEGWTITVTDDQEQEVGTDVTNETGFYRICGLVPGDYTVTEDLKEGWMNQTPLSVSVTVDESNVDNVNFTNEKILGTISGYKLDNATGLGIPDWVMTLSNGSATIDVTQTNESGFYIFSGLPFDTYTVTEELKTGYFNITPISQDDLVIDEETQNIENVNFTNEIGNGTVVGWIHTNCNLGELAVPEARVRASLSEDGLFINGSYWEVTTDIGGFYGISNLPTGVPLFITALSPESAPDKYHLYLYQVYPGSLIVCNETPCVVDLAPLAINETKQVNWIFTPNTSEFQST